MSWGIGQHGKLGQGTTMNEKMPRSISTLCMDCVTSVSAGGDFSLFLMANGEPYAFEPETKAAKFSL